MKHALQSLLEAIRATNGPTRVVIGAALVVLAGVAGLLTYRASHPHMVLLYGGLDDTQFAAVTAALSTERVRFETSLSAPYSVFVPEPEKYPALNAIHVVGAMDTGGKGIPTAAGSSTLWMGQSERDQITKKRDWEDLEKQLEALMWVEVARVRTSGGPRSPLLRERPPTVSVVVKVRGSVRPTREQRDTLASIVRSATNVPQENVTIADQHGTTLFDGSRDSTLDAVIEFEESFADSQTSRAQEFLDRTFGPGRSLVSVTGEWDHDRSESVDEALDPTKLKLSESVSETLTPIDSGFAGGPAGTQANIDRGTAPARGSAEPPAASTVDSDVRYAYSTKTTHVVSASPTLERLSVTLLLDSSLEAQLVEAEVFVKDLVGFDEARDRMTSSAIPLFTVERDEDGNPIAAEPESAPVAPNKTMTLLLERGVEILAAIAFLFVLLRSLRRGKDPEPDQPALPEIAEEEVDLELLARLQVEQMVASDPERVGALLSRWALGEKLYAGREE